MSRGKKVAIMLFLIVLVIVGFFLISFFGLPWKKMSVGQELQSYLEKRYDEKFIILERFYDFKNGKYGIVASPVKQRKITFHAEEGYGEYKYIDTYPEVLWEYQAQSELEPIAKKTFPHLKELVVSAGYGESADIVTGPKIQSYQNVHIPIMPHVYITGTYKGSEEQWQEMYHFFQEAKKRIKNLEIYFSYDSNQTKNAEVSIFCDRDAITHIKSLDDVKSKCRVMEFEFEKDK